jgi:hypothetical protein
VRNTPLRASFVTVVGGALVALMTAPARLDAQEPLVFFASVSDVSGNLITSLTADDVKVVENGAEGKVLKLESIDWPIKLQLLVDNGLGVNDALVQVRNGLKGLCTW